MLMLKVVMAVAVEITPMAREETAEMAGPVLSIEGAMEVMEVTANMAEGEMAEMVATVLPEAGVVGLGERDLAETGTMEEMEIRDN